MGSGSLLYSWYPLPSGSPASILAYGSSTVGTLVSTRGIAQQKSAVGGHGRVVRFQITRHLKELLLPCASPVRRPRGSLVFRVYRTYGIQGYYGNQVTGCQVASVNKY